MRSKPMPVQLKPSRRLSVVSALALMLALMFPIASPAQQSSGDQIVYATAEALESLDVQASQIDRLIAARLRNGEPVSDQIGQEQTAIFGELARFREIQRRHEARGETITGVPKTDTEALADRIAALRLQLRTGQQVTTGNVQAGDQSGVQPGALPTPVAIPEGTRVVIRLKGWLSSQDAKEGDRFEATAVDGVTVGDQTIIPKGALFQGYVAKVQKAKRPSRGGKLTLVIDRVQGADGQMTAVKATVVGAASDGEELKGDGVDGGGALQRGILGAVLGGLLGGGKGALIGLGVGGGSTVFAGKGEEVDLPPGSQLRVRFDTSVSVTWGPAPPTKQGQR
ncbi:MAG: hypothetical protein ACE5HV_00845 [Acidobacteriota bacterium]